MAPRTARAKTSSLAALRVALGEEIAKVVVGQADTLDAIVIAAAVGGHVLLEGAPGVAKTLLATTVGRALGLDVQRIQFTPDLLPSDVTGTMTLRNNQLVFRPGPVFTNILIADEINRTPPKTQAALLEAMQESQVTVDGQRRPIDEPFLVIATQNPIEYEGTYPLPEAQLDRFLLKVDVPYPTEDQELQMLDLAHRGVVPATLDDVNVVATAADLAAARAVVDATTVSPDVRGYVIALIRQTRVLPSVALGASPRAAVHLLAASRATARLDDRDYVTPDDVVRVAPAVLRHRLLLHAEAELERYTPDDAIRTAVAAVPVPR
ncbi:MAG: MoxR-like ATPase [Actinomycetota bacterium]